MVESSGVSLTTKLEHKTRDRAVQSTGEAFQLRISYHYDPNP